MTLREWLDKLEDFDPDNWGQLDELRARLSEEELDTDLEAEITFRTEAGTVDRVVIRLLDDSDQVKVELDYEILQLDSVVLALSSRKPLFHWNRVTQAQIYGDGSRILPLYSRASWRR